MIFRRCQLIILLVLVVVIGESRLSIADTKLSQFPNSLLSNPDFFPLAVWLQDPPNAIQYKALGINLYVGLWLGPTKAQLALLKAADMPVVSRMNETGLSDPNNDLIVGWMLQDEPDNVQGELKSGKSSPPISPNIVKEEYLHMRQIDPSRPVLLNLGQGVAWDQWHGRGPRTNHPEDYPKYVQSGDIISFDIYPVTHPDPAVGGKIEFVARGVDRLVKWTQGKKPIWSLVATSRVGNADISPTPDQVRSQVWLSIIHGATGIVYFVHQFRPNFVEASLLGDSEMSAAITKINSRISGLASLLKSYSLVGLVNVQPLVPTTVSGVTALVKRDECHLYIFAGNRSRFSGIYGFELETIIKDGQVMVMDESRAIEMRQRYFEDHFDPYEVHLYRLDHSSKDC
ncbi:MAG: beta-galactosidase [Proteobacteria bacterium]|nr:beta-galactosidase [Pseudomonadota bacterium]